MATNKVALRTVTEFMSDYKPVYQPIYPLFMQKTAAYPQEVGKVEFRRATAVGDIRAKHITPKDTEIKQIAVSEGTKSFKKYFLANQYIQSALQARDDIESITAEVLDEHQKQADELLLLGDGTAANNVLNNGLYWSADPNYRLESSAEVALGTAADHLRDFHTKILAMADVAGSTPGRKLLITYGTTVGSKINGLYANTDQPFKTVLAGVLGSEWNIAKLPSAVSPSGANGFIIINLDQVKLHYTVLPSLKDQGVNDEKMYAWFNFLMGSMMLEVLADDAVIRQPLTFAV